MENIHKFVSDPEHKKMLREGDGIGTSATRASIISELKRREFLETKGKQIVSTTLGRSVIDALPEVVKPGADRPLRAHVEGRRAGHGGPGRLHHEARDVHPRPGGEGQQRSREHRRRQGSHAGFYAAQVHGLRHGLSRRPAKRKGQFWWGCSNFPTCKQTYPDLKGRPDYSKGRNGPAE
jgi:DNA topoisomerase-3